MEGDKRTPEGKFKVLLKKIHPKWGFELLLDYPNEESIHKFKERIEEGLVPHNARFGSGIAIHATRPQEEWTVDYSSELDRWMRLFKIYWPRFI